MEKLHEYSTSVDWTGARKGNLESPELPRLISGAPPDFGGEGGIWSPEHFFVASAEVCVMLTFLAIAELSRIEVEGWSSSAKGKVDKVEGQGFMFTGIEIEARVRIAKASDKAKAEKALERADRNCLVSKSMKTPVIFRYNVSVAGE